MRLALLASLASVALGTGCPTKSADRPRASASLAIEIAGLEAARGGGVARLIELAAPAAGDAATRDLALRGLGRIGGARAFDALIAATEDPDPAIATRAATALGVLAATSDPPAAVVERASAALLATLARPGVDAAAVIEALGRTGATSALAPLTGRVAGADRVLAEAAAIALGRFGRRELALDGPARTALASAATATDADAVGLRRAAVWALGREHRGETPEPASQVTIALIAALADGDPEVRAGAAAALARRKAVIEAAPQLEQALRDPDWRVAVEAVRALAGEHGTDSGKDAVAAIVVRNWAVIRDGGAPATAHVVLEGLRALQASAARDAVVGAFAVIARPPAAGKTPIAPVVVDWARCLAAAGLARAEPAALDAAAILRCGGDQTKPAVRVRMLGDLIAAGVGPATDRARAVEQLLKDADANVRAVGFEAIAPLWPALSPSERHVMRTWLERAIGRATAAYEAGAAAETVGALMAGKDLTDADKRALGDALIARASAEPEPELAATMLGAIAAGKATDGRAACARAAAGASPVIRAAARACVDALDGRDPKAAAAARALDEPAEVAAPALDVAGVIGHRVTWTVETTRGTVVIELEPAVAPWHVASIVELTRKKTYDGLPFHRVVPDFVVQGGDPDGTGWGGPGYTLPAEPASVLERADYGAGAVGIADAGKDSGGSQWFVMHSRAPHLEGRYTRVGKVTRGQDVVDTLVIWDQVLQATVAVD
jgi:peptidylprolyl isomerase